MSSLRVGQRQEVTVDGLSHAGEGVGRVDGLVVFVPGALPGDRVRVRMISVKKTYARGVVEEIIAPSADRQDPECRVASRCGGCSLQHLNYPQQLHWKTRQVEDALRRIAGLDVAVSSIVGMEKPFGYRNKAQFPLQSCRGALVMGFYQPRTHDIVHLTECAIQHPLAMRAAHAVRRILQDLQVPAYDERTHQGVVRHIVTRVSFATNTAMVVLVTRTANWPISDELVGGLAKSVPQIVSIAHNINPQRTNAVFGSKTNIIWGDRYLYDDVGALKLAISPRSFFQVNPIQAEVLYGLVADRTVRTGDEVVWDLYCGIGSIGLYLANRVRRVVGVESISEAVTDARLNASLNCISNAEFIHGRAEDVIVQLSQRSVMANTVILDPPRRGCDSVLLDTLIALAVPRIVYVSCNPSSLARDLRRLVDGGYTVEEVIPIDMFPQTSHIETVVVLER